MNKKWERLKQADVYVRKVVVYCLLFILAAPLLAFVVVSLSSRMQKTASQDSGQIINLPEFEAMPGMDQLLNELSQLTNTSTDAQGETGKIE